ncbi:MAG: hypothetical protein ACLFU8_14410 [Anaerolineales bacterium]
MSEHFEDYYPGPERPERRGDRFKAGIVMGLIVGVAVGFVIGLLAAGHPAFDDKTPMLFPVAMALIVALVLFLARREKGRTGSRREDDAPGGAEPPLSLIWQPPTRGRGLLAVLLGVFTALGLALLVLLRPSKIGLGL